MSKEKRELHDWEQAECAALKAAIHAYNAERPRAERLTQEAAGAKLGMNQGSFSGYLNGRQALNKEVATKVSRLFGIPVKAFSPRLAEEIVQMAGTTGQDYRNDERYQATTQEHRQAIDEVATDMLNLSPEQAIQFKQAIKLLMRATNSPSDA